MTTTKLFHHPHDVGLYYWPTLFKENSGKVIRTGRLATRQISIMYFLLGDGVIEVV
jgi:hypothetical protein